MNSWRVDALSRKHPNIRLVTSVGQTRTKMLSVAPHIGQPKVRKSKPGLSGSRRERIIGASQSAQNGRSLVALPWKNEGPERLSITLPLVGRERITPRSPIAAGTVP